MHAKFCISLNFFRSDMVVLSKKLHKSLRLGIYFASENHICWETELRHKPSVKISIFQDLLISNLKPLMTSFWYLINKQSILVL